MLGTGPDGHHGCVYLVGFAGSGAVQSHICAQLASDDGSYISIECLHGISPSIDVLPIIHAVTLMSTGY